MRYLGRMAIAATICGLSAIVPRAAHADALLFVEARSVPPDCAHPVTCLPQSRLVARNILSLSERNYASLVSVLNRSASVRGIPENAVPGQCSRFVDQLHDLEIAPKLEPLKDHPGVFFDGSALDKDPKTEGFADFVRRELKRIGVKLLTKSEMDETPGRPTLSVRFKERTESAGCIIPFSLTMSITEEVVLTRRADVKLTAGVWFYGRKENLANTNYRPRNALSELLSKFAEDWRKMNPGT